MGETPKHRWFRFSLRSVFVVVTVVAVMIAVIVGVRHYVWQSGWAMIQRATRMQAVQYTSNIEITFGPSWTEPLWAVVRFEIPPENVMTFAERNQCDPSDRIEFRDTENPAKRSPTLPLAGDHFYKSDDTITGKPYELFIDSTGLVIAYVMLDD